MQWTIWEIVAYPGTSQIPFSCTHLSSPPLIDMSLKLRGAACTQHTRTLEGSIDGRGFWPLCTQHTGTLEGSIDGRGLWPLCIALTFSHLHYSVREKAARVLLTEEQQAQGHGLYLPHPCGEVLFRLSYLPASPKY